MDLKKLESDVEHLVKVQRDSYDFDPYMHGMYNGMELIFAMIQEREPKFLDAPDEWTNDTTIEHLDNSDTTETKELPTMYDSDFQGEDSQVKIDGTIFKCHCKANVGRYSNDGNYWKCNSCDTIYGVS